MPRVELAGAAATVADFLLSDDALFVDVEVCAVLTVGGTSVDPFLAADGGCPIIGFVRLGSFGSTERLDAACCSVFVLLDVVSSGFLAAEGGLEPTGAVVEATAAESPCFRFADGGREPTGALAELIAVESSCFRFAVDGLDPLTPFIALLSVVFSVFLLAVGGLEFVEVVVASSICGVRVGSITFTADPGRTVVADVVPAALLADCGRSYGVKVGETTPEA